MLRVDKAAPPSIFGILPPTLSTIICFVRRSRPGFFSSFGTANHDQGRFRGRLVRRGAAPLWPAGTSARGTVPSFVTTTHSTGRGPSHSSQSNKNIPTLGVTVAWLLQPKQLQSLMVKHTNKVVVLTMSIFLFLGKPTRPTMPCKPKLLRQTNKDGP